MLVHNDWFQFKTIVTSLETVNNSSITVDQSETIVMIAPEMGVNIDELVQEWWNSVRSIESESCHDAKLSPLVALEVVVVITSSASSDDSVGIMMTLGFYPRSVLAFGYCRCLFVCVCVRATTCYPFRVGAPNFDQRWTKPQLKFLLFCRVFELDPQGHFYSHFELVYAITHHLFQLGFPNLDQNDAS